ncbi:armadillo-type protein [Pisolithus albus]|nr:armadillo-type protein [Pisolithus albus]
MWASIKHVLSQVLPSDKVPTSPLRGPFRTDIWVHISLFSDSASTSSSDVASSQFQESVWVAADGLHGDLDSALWYSQSAGIASYDHYSEHLWKPWQDPSDNIHPWVDTSDNSFDYPPYYPLLLSLDSPPVPIEHSSQRGDGESSLGSIPVQLPLPLAPGPVHHGKNGSAHQTDTPPHDYRVNDRYPSPVPSPLNDTAASIAGLPSSHHAERRGCVASKKRCIEELGSYNVKEEAGARLPAVSTTILCGRVELLAQEAAHVISSLVYGSEITLSSLLRANAHQEVVRALANPHALHDPRLKAALARGLCVLANSMADVVGHSHGSIRAYTSEHLAETKVALNFHFQYECLDVYFPLLDDSSPQTSLSISQLIGAAVLTDAHRTVIIEWFPPPERRQKEAANGKHGAWVLRHLVGMTQRKDVKTQEVALSALGALAMDNPTVANILAKTSLEASLASLVKSLTPLENTCDWEIDEPEYRATLKAIAAISLFDKVIKREVADTYDLMPIIQACLTQKNVGVRCSACHCLCSLSRDTAVIRTNITDSGAGMALYQMFKKEDEDRFLPSTQRRFGRRAVTETVDAIIWDGEQPRMKVTTMQHLGWSHLAELANDSDPEIQEQAFAIQRNLTEDETGVSLVFETMGDDTRIVCL